jgi:hydrogenase maturation protein HypF
MPDGETVSAETAHRSLRISVRGVVQGVGFRPFVFKLAHEHGLAGWVRNTSGSVEIEVEGPAKAVESFQFALTAEAPPVARIEAVTATPIAIRGYQSFEIGRSLAEEGKYQLVSPDIATCLPCREEIFSPENRRYRYPFTNCTNCGPRFTIIEDIPYDRPRTTMRQFRMCADCQREYDDPLDRRFHAQPNACPVCGPRLDLVDSAGKGVAGGDVIRSAADLLREGRILAIKGLGGLLLACDATSREAVNVLRERKHRPSKPFAVMLASIDEVRRHCLVSPDEQSLLLSPQCPIVLLRWQEKESDICPEVAPGLKHLGVMLPYTPLHHLLMRETNLPLIMTSGNLSEEPIARDNDEALRRLGHIADCFLVHDRGISAKYDDSVYMVEQDGPRAVRRARGYAPYPVFVPFQARPVLACGAEEKNTFCLTRDGHAFVSQHIGDMENEETLRHFEDTVDLYKKLFRIEPEIVAYDLHPEYLSTKYALGLKAEGKPGLRFVGVQHHHAHVVSCMVENNVEAPVIGVALDGTGYGTDGTLWGGEFLVADWRGSERVGCLEPVPMPGGAAAIHRPYRMALGYLFSLMGHDTPLRGLPILERIDSAEVAVIRRQIGRKLNSPLTSGAGRLFDAVSALAGVRAVVDYEAQAAIELEMLATDAPVPADSSVYPFSVVEEGGCRMVKLADMISAVAGDVKKGVPPPLISARFHRTLARMIVHMCRLIAGDGGIRPVALTGGVFQNRLLLGLTIEALRREGFEVLTHRIVPCNDGGISLGQAVIANFAAP